MQKFNFWKSKGFAPRVIYDIGANIGEWTTECKRYFPTADYFLFEAFADNQSKNIHPNYHVVLLDKQDNEIKPFYCTKGQFNTGNSMYRELTKHFSGDQYNTMYIPTKTLDTFVKEREIPFPDFIKIDVQGGELDVLKGGQACMQHAQMILLEVSIHQYNQQSPLFAEVIQYMDTHGFEMIDMIDQHHIDSYLAQLDILFTKKGSGFRRENFYG